MRSPLCTKELDVFLGVRGVGGGMGKMAQGEVLEGGRGRSHRAADSSPTKYKGKL